MKPKHIKDVLLSEIRAVAAKPEEFCYDPHRDFTRKRKLSFESMIKNIIGMGSKSLTNEMIDLFQASSEMPSASAFVQKRAKIKPEALKSVFDRFTQKMLTMPSDEMKILAVDGSDIQIATNPQDESSFFQGANGQKPYNLLHLNALYSLDQHIYVDAIIQGRWDWNEHAALQTMVDHSNIPKALVIADRGYESYNNMAHIQEKGWSFLIRVKDGKTGIKEGLVLPNKDEFDVDISLKLTRKQTNDIKELLKDKNHYRFIPSTTPFDYLPQKSRKHDPIRFYELNFRVVRFRITPDTFETVLTNLDAGKYPPEEVKKLYAARWGIETSFRDLKYTIGLLKYHSKKTACIRQEIFARLILYNFVEVITSHVAISKKQRKYTYKCNFSVATHVCRLFLRGQTSPPYVESAIAKCLIPIRPNRKRNRFVLGEVLQRFFYRVA